jgi:hypothetical protein
MRQNLYSSWPDLQDRHCIAARDVRLHVLNPCRSEPRAPCLQVEDAGWRSERAFHDVHTNGPGCTTRHNPPVEIGEFCGKMSLPKGIDLYFNRGVDLRSIHWRLTRSDIVCCPLCGGRQGIGCRHCTLDSDVCYGLSCKRDSPHQGEPRQSHCGPIEVFPLCTAHMISSGPSPDGLQPRLFGHQYTTGRGPEA